MFIYVIAASSGSLDLSWGEEMKKLFVAIIVFLINGCDVSDRVVHDAPYLKRSGENKIAISEQFLTNNDFKPIVIPEGQKFYSVNEWYNQDTVIYSVGESGGSSLYLHKINTGERSLFFQSEEWIGKIEANIDNSLFAVQTIEKNGTSHLRILNKMGHEIFTRSSKIEELQFLWNPYAPNELIVTEFLPNFDFRLFKINVTEKEIYQIPLEHPFVQWISKDELVYLDWNQNEFTLEAPVFLYNLKTLENKKWLDSSIMLFSMKDIIASVTMIKSDYQQSRYTFYDAKTRTKRTEINIPVLNTFSEAWWVPSFDFDEKKQLFYFMKPNRAGDIAEYKDGFQLTALTMDGKEVELINVTGNVPIKLSPTGDWCLIGNQLEQVLNISDQQIYNLVLQ